MSRKICLLCCTFLLLIFSGGTVSACTCIAAFSPCQAYGGASAVFVGTAIAVRTTERTTTRDPNKIDWFPMTFKFAVEQSFLGIEGREVEVSTGMGGGDCGFSFTVGERYLVYAFRSSADKRLSTGICTRTNSYAKAEKDLEFLRSLSARAAGVTIHGDVKRLLQNVAKGDSAPAGPLANASLIVEGKDLRRELQTDAEGRYSVTGLESGTYKVTLHLPDELTTYKTEQEVTVADRGCAGVSYYVTDNGRISGTIVDAEGQPVAKVVVALVDADKVDPLKNYSKLEETDEKGQYKFSSVPPGKYLVAINLMRFPQYDNPTNAFPRAFYPGVPDAKDAEVILLGAGENVRGKDLRLSTRRAPSVISGKVVWADGQPVANAGITFRDVTYHDAGMDHGMSTDEQGYFTIKGYVGQTFVIAARSDQRFIDFSKERSQPVRLTLANPTEFVKIVITRMR